jgi:hypothetical protein
VTVSNAPPQSGMLLDRVREQVAQYAELRHRS